MKKLQLNKPDLIITLYHINTKAIQKCMTNSTPPRFKPLIHNILHNVNKLTIYIIVLFTMPFCISCNNDRPQIELIAHAGGEINGYIYTNSLEAVQNSIKDGYKFIELDLALTADSILVAVHDWREFNEMTGYPQKNDTIPTFEEFTKRCIHGKYTPLSATMINSIFLGDTTLYLVTDKISNPEILDQNFPNLKQRMVVEAYGYNNYTTLCDDGYFRVLYSRYDTQFYENIIKHMLFHYLYDGHKINWISTHAGNITIEFLKNCSKYTEVNLAVYTINDVKNIPEVDTDIIKMVYTDSIKPHQ